MSAVTQVARLGSLQQGMSSTVPPTRSGSPRVTKETGGTAGPGIYQTGRENIIIILIIIFIIIQIIIIIIINHLFYFTLYNTVRI